LFLSSYIKGGKLEERFIPMAFKAAIFDLDGVIVDTVPIHFKAWKRMFADYGKGFTLDDYKKKVDGIPRVDGCRAILTDLSDDEIKAAGDKKQAYYLEYLQEEGIRVYDSSVVLIRRLIENSIKTAVISSSKNLLMILQRTGLKGLFEVIISGNDISKGKPDPQVFLMAARRLDVLPDESLVFEDATLGIEAAKKAGMRCVGIDRDGNPGLFNKADVVVHDLSEIGLEKIIALF
jgi:beta-phosphoglucomutase